MKKLLPILLIVACFTGNSYASLHCGAVQESLLRQLLFDGYYNAAASNSSDLSGAIYKLYATSSFELDGTCSVVIDYCNSYFKKIPVNAPSQVPYFVNSSTDPRLVVALSKKDNSEFAIRSKGKTKGWCNKFNNLKPIAEDSIICENKKNETPSGTAKCPCNFFWCKVGEKVLVYEATQVSSKEKKTMTLYEIRSGKSFKFEGIY